MSFFEVFLYLFVPVSVLIIAWCAMLLNGRSVRRFRLKAANASTVIGRENDLGSDRTWWILPLAVIVIIGGAGIWFSRRNS